MAGIAAGLSRRRNGPRHGGRGRMTAVSARFGTDSAALALISATRLVPDRLPAVAFAVRIWHRTAVGARTSPFNIFGCGCSSVVEHDLAKVGVEGSSPFARSKFLLAA